MIRPRELESPSPLKWSVGRGVDVWDLFRACLDGDLDAVTRLVTRDPALVLSRLSRGLGARDIVLLHDGHAARGPSGEPVIVEVLPALIERIRAAGLAPVTLAEALPA